MRWQIYGVWISFIISLIGLGLIVWTIEPQTASLLIKSLFFIVLFILTWGVATLILFYAQNRLARARALSSAAYEPIFYDSFLTGFFITVILFLIILIKRVF